MLFPSVCWDNFFSNPKEVVKFANSLPYKPSKDGAWPGVRTGPLHTIDRDFFEYVGDRFLSVLFPNTYTKVEYEECFMYFQKISNAYVDPGWIHQDSPPSDLTLIIYLSDHKNCGTSIFDFKGHRPVNLNIKEKFTEYKHKKRNTKAVLEHNEPFEETIRFHSKFNRAVFFDGGAFHGVLNHVDKNLKEDRLTLICFYKGFTKTKYPLIESARAGRLGGGNNSSLDLL